MKSEPGPCQGVDICVIGAGPAGSTLAIRLAQFGYSVCVIERLIFPRSRVGESLSVGVWPQLELLGVDRTVAAAGFRPCRTSLVQWESDVPLRREFGALGGLLVDRGRFDALLLDRARANGVHLMQPAAVRTWVCHDQRWHIKIESANGIRALVADFLVDASGRSAALRGHKQRTGPRTLALYGYWRGGRLPDDPQIEAALDAWYWGIPLPDSTYNAIVFVDAADFRARRNASLEESYVALIGRSSLMVGCRGARLSGPVRAADATSYLDGNSIGPRSIKVGEAALALDPLSSSGVQKAINTSLTAAVVVNTLLRCPQQADAATRFYTRSLIEASDRHRSWAAEHYAVAAATRPGRFWQTRAADVATEPKRTAPLHDCGPPLSGDCVITLSPEATLSPEPCIVGSLVAMKSALRHPGLERPVAFLGDWEVAALLEPLHRGMTIRGLMDAWQIPVRSKPAIASWLLKHGVLAVPQTTR
jgi:flavin-dependent dehydrogenase